MGTQKVCSRAKKHLAVPATDAVYQLEDLMARQSPELVTPLQTFFSAKRPSTGQGARHSAQERTTSSGMECGRLRGFRARDQLHFCRVGRKPTCQPANGKAATNALDQARRPPVVAGPRGSEDPIRRVA